MYQKILVPVDGSDTALLGLNEAVKLAKNQSGAIRLVHIVDEYVLDYAYSPGLYATNVIETMRATGQSVLDKATALVKESGVPVESVLLETIGGPAADLIVEQAKAWPADLIVIGTHGRRGLRRLAMGSDAEQVLRSAPVPVLLVRRAEKA
ncbi:MAG: universal stress protein [Steroidobacteraceae bacterium]|jgi:nucleotide-binding universal stress UspA family protein